MLRDELESHLATLRRSKQLQIITWYDREILPGTEWKREIDTHLDASDIILLLISSDFIESDYCYGVEMHRALERHRAEVTPVIPVILRPCNWKELPISILQVLPEDGKPITRWRNRDEAFQNVVAGIGKVVNRSIAQKAQETNGEHGTTDQPARERKPKIPANIEHAFQTQEQERPERVPSLLSPRPRRFPPTRVALLLLLILLGVGGSLGGYWFIRSIPPQIGTITEFPISTANNSLQSITAGPDGNLWFTESDGWIGRMTPQGEVLSLRFRAPEPEYMILGPDGNFWFTEYYRDMIGRMTPQGQLQEFPTLKGSHPDTITTGSDGNLWFTENLGGNIGRITPAGALTEFPTGSIGLNGITPGPHGGLWFVATSTYSIGRITPSGEITLFPLPKNPSSRSEPYGGITFGSDGYIWFTEYNNDKIGRIDTSGTVAEFPLPKYSGPLDITTGSDGNLWFLEARGNKVGRITPDGKVTEFPIPTPNSAPRAITSGPDGNIWFVEAQSNRIGRILV